MAGERVLDRFDSFDLGKQNTTHIFRLSTFASSRHNYTLIVLANILQRSMKSPGALAAATAASDFMRFLAYFTNLPRSARSRKRIKKKCQRGNRRNQVEHPVTFSKLKPPHQYYGFPWLVLSVGDMKLWCSKFNANVLEVGQNHIHIYHTRILRTHIRCLHIMQNQMATDDIEWQWKCNQQCLPVACQNETEPEEQKRQSASGFSRHLTAGDKRQMKQTLESHDKQEKKCHTPQVQSQKIMYNQHLSHFLHFLSWWWWWWKMFFWLEKPKCATCANFWSFSWFRTLLVFSRKSGKRNFET